MYPPPQGDQPPQQPPYGSPPPNYGQQPGYGAPLAYGQQPYAYPGAVPMVPQSNGLATASLVLGILVFLLGLLTGIPAVITGHMALGRIKQNPGLPGRGQAIAGLVLGYLSIGGTVLVILLVVIAAATGAGTATSTP